MGAGWQKWWRRPRTLEDAYREEPVADTAAKRHKGQATRVDFQLLVFDPGPYRELAEFYEWLNRATRLALRWPR